MASVYGTLLQQVKAKIASLAIASVTIDIRKRFVMLDEDTYPLILVCPLTEQESEVDGGEGFELTLDVSYPIFIGTAYVSGNVLGGTTLFTALETRQTIRRALRTVTLPNVSGISCVQVSADLDPAFDRPAARDNLDMSGMILTYTMQEPRNV